MSTPINKNMGVFALVFLLFFLFAQNVHALGEDGYTEQRTNYWNSLITSDQSYARGINTVGSSQIPILANMTGTQQYVVITDGEYIELYTAPGTSLGIVDSKKMGATGLTLQQPTSADLDNDGKEELYIPYVNGSYAVVTYNGSAFTDTRHNLNLTVTYPYTLTGFSSAMISCVPENGYCLGVYAGGTGAANNYGANAYLINASGEASNVALQAGQSASYQLLCLPSNPSADFVTYDGTSTFVFSAGVPGAAYAYYVSVNPSTNALTSRTSAAITANIGSVSAPNNCATRYNGYRVGETFTPAITADFDGAVSNGYETVIASKNALDTVKMSVLSWDGSIEEQYPELSSADGEYISNPTRCSIFHDTEDYTDFCVMIFDASENMIRLLAGSLTTSEYPISYQFETNQTWAPTGQIYTQSSPRLIHATQTAFNTHSQLSGFSTVTVNPTEFLTPYGIFQPRYEDTGVWTECLSFNDCPAQFISTTFPFTWGRAIFADPQNVGSVDIIATTNTTLFYLDDGYSNTGCAGQECIDGSQTYISPCLELAWLTNTTVSITLTTQEVDGDKVAARAILYYGDDDALQDSGWSDNYTAGTALTYSFIANKSTVSSVLRLQARDDYDPSSVQTRDIPFSVNPSGIAFGSCTTTLGSVEAETETGGAGAGNVTGSDPISSLMDNIEQETGTDATVIILIIMVIITAMVWMKGTGEPSQRLGVALIINAFIMTIAVWLGFFSVALFVTTLIIIIAAAVFSFMRRNGGY